MAQWVEDGEVLATLPQKTWDPHREVLISKQFRRRKAMTGMQRWCRLSMNRMIPNALC